MSIPDLKPPFSTDGELHIPLHVLCWPRSYINIVDSTGAVALVVPADTYQKDDKVLVNDESTKAKAATIVKMLNRAAKDESFLQELLRETKELNDE